MARRNEAEFGVIYGYATDSYDVNSGKREGWICTSS